MEDIRDVTNPWRKNSMSSGISFKNQKQPHKKTRTNLQSMFHRQKGTRFFDSPSDGFLPTLPIDQNQGEHVKHLPIMQSPSINKDDKKGDQPSRRRENTPKLTFSEYD
jgi:hypothetical protein